MTPSLAAEDFRKMARYIRKHGFSPEEVVGNCKCGCFMHAFSEATLGEAPFYLLLDVIGAEWFDTDSLIAAGWTSGATDDAAAACDILADLLTP